jgi:hypothetical protein
MHITKFSGKNMVLVTNSERIRRKPCVHVSELRTALIHFVLAGTSLIPLLAVT